MSMVVALKNSDTRLMASWWMLALIESGIWMVAIFSPFWCACLPVRRQGFQSVLWGRSRGDISGWLPVSLAGAVYSGPESAQVFLKS